MADPGERLEAMVAALKQRGLRITPQRLAVLAILAQSRSHPSVEEIHRRVLSQFPTTSLATIYKTINLLKELGEVLELGFSDWGSRYDGRHPQPHPHVICTRCGAIADPDYADMPQMAREMAVKSGYHITSHRLDFFGLCPACRETA